MEKIMESYIEHILGKILTGFSSVCFCETSNSSLLFLHILLKEDLWLGPLFTFHKLHVWLSMHFKICMDLLGRVSRFQPSTLLSNIYNYLLCFKWAEA